jgi:hypothetical protein
MVGMRTGAPTVDRSRPTCLRRSRFRPASASAAAAPTSGAIRFAGTAFVKPKMTPDFGTSPASSDRTRSTQETATASAANGTPATAARRRTPPPSE